MTQFEIECKCGGHSVSKKFKTIFKYCWPNLSNTFSMLKFTFLAEKLENAHSHPKKNLYMSKIKKSLKKKLPFLRIPVSFDVIPPFQRFFFGFGGKINVPI